MCKLGDIIVVKEFKNEEGISVPKHSFVVINDEEDYVEGLKYDFVSNMMCSFHNEEHKNKKLKYEENLPIKEEYVSGDKINSKEGYIDLDTIIADGLHHTLNPKKIVLENLERLNIINLSSNIMLPENKNIVKNAFIHYKDSYSGRDKPSNANVTYTEGLLTITDFGWNFIDICCSW